MKYLSVLLLFAIIGLYSNANAQQVKGSGKLKTETIEHKGFRHLILQGRFELTITQGDIEGTRITADDNLINLFQTRLDGDVLYITMLADLRKSDLMTVNLSVRDLQSITLLNQINLKSEDVLHFDELSIFSSGTSQINCELYTTQLTLALHDESFTKLKGYSEALSINTHDETELNAFLLKSEKCQVISTGYSEVMLNCQETLKLKVTGESNVYYTGEPKIGERVFSSAGFIVKRKASQVD